MRLSEEAFVRNCNPDRDLEGVVRNIMEIGPGYYREGQDSISSLRGFLSRTEDSVIVVDDPNHNVIAGNLYVPDSQIPLLSRLAINPVFDHPRDQWEISRLLLNRGFDIILARTPTMPHAEILHDWPPYLARSKPLPPFRVEYERYGFMFTHDLYSTEYTFRWDEDGKLIGIPPYPVAEQSVA